MACFYCTLFAPPVSLSLPAEAQDTSRIPPVSHRYLCQAGGWPLVGYNPPMTTQLQTNQPAPDFALPDLDGNTHRLSDYRGHIVIINFWSAECPHAARTDEALRPWLEAWGGEVILLPIAANANEPPEMLRRVAEARGLPFVLHDEQRKVADLYGALTTPHVFLVDREGILRYQGAFDDVTFRQPQPKRLYIKEAVEALLTGRLPEVDSTPAYGCTIVRYT